MVPLEELEDELELLELEEELVLLDELALDDEEELLELEDDELLVDPPGLEAAPQPAKAAVAKTNRNPRESRITFFIVVVRNRGPILLSYDVYNSLIH
jgi:hypothetical protein